ncbi:MAG: SMP-30/gluconolactonase/LRE family protein [Anaerolineales bacterium]|nr:SMP-30/gluconolactonase/LRE family protein [Anaerolineales bacterium]
MADAVEVVVNAGAEHGEGAIWHAQTHRFYWVDIMKGLVYIYDPAANTNRAINVGQPVGTVVPRRSGGLMLAVERGFAALDLETEALTILADPADRAPRTRFNDGKCDPAGRFWAGTMSYDSGVIGAGALYCLDADHKVWPRVANVSIANGIVWTKDKRTMYFIDTLAYTLDRFDYDHATGQISNRRPLICFPETQGFPDGMAIDAEDKVWVAVMGSGRVFRYDPESAALLSTVELPTPQITSCAFGGPNLDELYITSSTLGLSPEALANDPLAGVLFKARPGVQGVPADEYAG